jgi:hydrogenase maturation protein HypF
MTISANICARRVRVGGIVQGVGFRPFVYRLAAQYALSGSVVNSPSGADIVIEGAPTAIDAFVSDLRARPPAAAMIVDIDVQAVEPSGRIGFCIRDSERHGSPSTQISVDLPVCEECLRELFDRHDRRFRYPYINCTNCGPRFSLATSLPYDRQTTTMAPWAMCLECQREFNDPSDRRFHAQPIACPKCGPTYRLIRDRRAQLSDFEALEQTARLLADGAIVAIKGIGGYHLACDARNARSVEELRRRKYRKSRAFAVMVRDVSTAGALVELNEQSEAMLVSRARPIVLAPARVDLAGVAPAHPDVGVMLPYTPLHHLLFASGTPDSIVMTSGNRSSEPIAFDDEDALCRLDGIADAFLVGERAIARRVDDSVVHSTPLGAMTVRRSRGYAPAVVTRLETDNPILAVGGDLKNTIALAVDGNVMLSQYIGDLGHHATRVAFDQTVGDFLRLYDVNPSRLIVAHDLHPQYASTEYALALSARRHVAVQHHRAHVASVAAERSALTTCLLGVAFDGTGYGDDGSIWGGEFFVGSVRDGLERVASLRPVTLAGGDATAAWPVQAAAGFVAQVDEVRELPELFEMPERYHQARRLVARGIRTFTSTSAGRLFDAVAALLGFTSHVTFEGQAAIWLEHQAAAANGSVVVPFEYAAGYLDWRPAVRSMIRARLAGEDLRAIARGFHSGLAEGIASATARLCCEHQVSTVVLTGGVFQNRLLVSDLNELLTARRLTAWVNQVVPVGDGGLSLGQAAIVSLRTQ